MVLTDIGRAVVIATIPVAGLMGVLSIWWIYVVMFLNSTLGIAFEAAAFAAIPSLVEQDDLVSANGRIQAGYNAATIGGPLLAGMAIAFFPVEDVLFVDAASFVVSALSLTMIARSFNDIKKDRSTTSIREDIVEGLRYVIRHPVLRNISLMMSMMNFIFVTVWAQRVLFAKEQLGASDEMLGIMWSAGTVGVIFFSLFAGQFRKRWSFGKVALGSLMAQGALVVALAFTTNFWVAVPLFAVMSGVGSMFNINTGSLRQAIVPRHMLGRILTIAGVLAWSANPLGALLGGYLIESTGQVALIYAIIGVLSIIIPAIFYFSPLGHAEDYIPKKEEEPASAAPLEDRTPPEASEAELEEAVATS
jgi:MFS family permease